jgi:hypothetical protein
MLTGDTAVGHLEQGRQRWIRADIRTRSGDDHLAGRLDQILGCTDRSGPKLLIECGAKRS